MQKQKQKLKAHIAAVCWPSSDKAYLIYKLKLYIKHNKSVGFVSCDQPSNLAEIGSKLSIFLDCVILKFVASPPEIIKNLFHFPRSFVCCFITIYESKLEFSSGNTQIGDKLSIFFGLCDLEIW